MSDDISPDKSGEANIEEIRLGFYEIRPDDISLEGVDENGQPIVLSDYRVDKDGRPDDILARALYTKNDELVSEEVRLNKQVRAYGKTDVEVIDHKKTINGKKAAGVVIGLAFTAGAGLLIKRYRRKDG